MQAPLVPQKKELDPHLTIDPRNIFKEQLVMNKKGSILNEMTSFNTKRVDLLHQLNQALYKKHM